MITALQEKQKNYIKERKKPDSQKLKFQFNFENVLEITSKYSYLWFTLNHDKKSTINSPNDTNCKN